MENMFLGVCTIAKEKETATLPKFNSEFAPENHWFEDDSCPLGANC